MTQAHQQLVHVCVCLTLTVPRVGYKDVSQEGPQAKREREGEREEGGEEGGRGRRGKEREGEKRVSWNNTTTLHWRCSPIWKPSCRVWTQHVHSY